MPFPIQPALGEQPLADSSSGAPPALFSPNMDWLAKQAYSPTEANFETGMYAPGHLLGGPTNELARIYQDPRKFEVFKPAPLLTSAAETQSKAFGRFGNITLDMIDPFATVASAEQGVGVDPAQANRAAGGVASFFAERDISLSNAPVRMFDYGTSLLRAIADQAQGKPIPTVMPSDASELKYNFQRDRGYWAVLEHATPEQLRALAGSVAAQYTDVATNPYLREALLAQFKIDQEVALGLSSGDRRTDYLAKIAFTADYITARTGGPARPIRAPGAHGGGKFAPVRPQYSSEGSVAAMAQLPAAIVTAIPIVGSDLAEGLYRSPKLIEDEWAKLTPEQRAKYFGQVGPLETLGDVAIWLPALGGLGAAEAVAARAGGVAGKVLQGYTALRNVTAAVMATGVVTLGANSALEFAVPGYAEGFGKRIDYARPWSTSPLAGLINNVGFFSSGTFGANLAARTIAKTAARVPGVSAIAGGARELGYFRDGFGGSRVTAELARTGLPDAGLLDIAPKATWHSELENVLEGDRRKMWDGALRGELTGDPLIDALSMEDKLAAANSDLARGAHGNGATTTDVVKAMLEARRPRPLLGSLAQDAHDVAVRVAGMVDQKVRDALMDRYGPSYMARRAGAYDAAALEREARGTVTRLGGNGELLAGHDAAGWAQVIRTLDAYEYMKNNGLLHAVIDGPPLAEEGTRVMLMRSNHLFGNDVDELLARVESADPAVSSAAIAKTIRDTPEASEWFANDWQPERGVARRLENVPAGEFATWLREISPALPSRRILPEATSPTAGLPLNVFHGQLEAAGRYTLGFKPVDEAGEFVSYVRRGDGRAFKSPWVEYPLGNVESIEMGGRNLLGSKLDAVFRGVRTRQILEFQKGLLYRRLSTRFDVTPEQIERFHAGVLRIASEAKVQPQTVGAVSRSSLGLFGAPSLAKEVGELAAEVFGAGDMALKRGGSVAVNWPDEIAKSYRQSLKLNFTAGLLSYMKANFGELGSAMAWLSDPAYVAWRFNLVPLFKGGEIWESQQFNLMLGVRGIDANARSLYQRVGIGNDYSALNTERPFDPMLASISSTRQDIAEASTAAGRQARAYSFYARRLPEDMELRIRTATTQAEAARHLESLKPPAQSYDEIAVGAAPLPAEPIPLELPPLAEDEAGLMAQLHETLAAAPTGEDIGRTLVGGNGFAPGLEERGRAILTKLEDLQAAKLDGGPTFAWADITPEQQLAQKATFRDAGWKPLGESIQEAYDAGRIEDGQALNKLAGGSAESGGAIAAAREELWARPKLDGSIDVKPISRIYDEAQRAPGAIEDLAMSAGTPEALFENVAPREAAKELEAGTLRGKAAAAWRSFTNPAPFKIGKLTDLEIKLARDRFPALLQLSGNDGLARVLTELGVPEKRWFDFMIQDRALLSDWLATGDQVAEDALLGHAGDTLLRDRLDTFHTSEDWNALSTLVRVNIEASASEAFGVHFFAAYRSPLERAINHPLLGIYPASWSLKAARTWAKFLYDNESLGLKIGMAPAVAIQRLIHAQESALARTGGTEETDAFSQNGPLGSPMMILNLLLPGDWSGIPFPASRLIRDYSRPLLANGTMPSAAAVIQNEIVNIGLGRDARLFAESIGQIADVVRGPQVPIPVKHAAAIHSVRDGVVPTYQEPFR